MECLDLLSDELGTTVLPHYEFSVSRRFSAKARSKSMLTGDPSIPCVGRRGWMARLPVLRLSGHCQL